MEQVEQDLLTGQVIVRQEPQVVEAVELDLLYQQVELVVVVAVELEEIFQVVVQQQVLQVLDLVEAVDLNQLDLVVLEDQA